MAISSLLVPGVSIPQPDNSWIGNLSNSITQGLEQRAQNRSFGKLADTIAGGGAPGPAQAQPNFFQRLMGQTAIPQSGAQQELATSNPGPKVNVGAPVISDGISASPDASALNGYLSDPSRRSSLPAGMRNNNPGNIKFVGQNVPGIVGPSTNTDQGDPQAVFATPEAGMAAMHNLLLRKYNGGKVTADQIIAGNGGWTPGNHEAAANVARYAGIRPDQDINFNDPQMASRFMRGLMMQEHGNSSRLYPDSMIASVVGGQPSAGGTASAYSEPAPNNPAVAAINAIAPQGGGAQVASLDPSIGIPLPGAAGQMRATDPNANTGQLAPAQASSAPAANPPLQPPVTQQPQQTAQVVTGAPQGSAITGQQLTQPVTPANRGGITNQQIADLVRNPYTRETGLALWQQVLGKANASPWKFMTTPDGTLIRTNEQTGESQAVSNFTKPDNSVTNVNGTLVRNATGEKVYVGGPNTRVLTADEKAQMGLPANTPFQIDQEGKVSQIGGNGTTVNVAAPENSTSAAAGAGLGKVISNMFDEGQQARADSATIGELRDALAKSPNGILGAISSKAQDWGINLGKNADQIQVAKAVISKLVPSQHVAGSGSSSDLDAKNFANSLPRLSGTAEGNQVILDTMDAMANYKQAQSDLAAQYYIDAQQPQQPGQPSALEKFVTGIRGLQDPFAAYKSYVKVNGGQTQIGGGNAGRGTQDVDTSKMPHPQTQADFDKLKPGETYVDPDDGQLYTKPKPNR